jgi:hypothetical protein
MEKELKPKTKLSLKKEVLAALDDSEIVTLNGGFTSIGHHCSHDNNCSRIHGYHLTPNHGGCPHYY